MTQDHRQVIEILALCFPKAFFVEPRQRLPLKIRIEKDIKSEDVALAAGQPVDVNGAVDFYRSHIGYEMALQAGAARYDLLGNRVGTVTVTEANEAKQRLAEIYRRKQERQEREQQTPVTVGKVLQSMHGNNTADQYKKFDAPPLPKVSVTPPPPMPAAATQASRPVKGLSPEQKHHIIVRYRVGEHTDGIMRDYGISSTTLYSVLHAAEVPLRQPRPASGKPHVDAPSLAPQPTVAMPDPAPIAVVDKKQLELAIKRIDLASANATADRECAVWALRSAADILQAALNRLETGQKHEDGRS